MKRLERIASAVLATIVVSGCGMSTVVQGQPMPAVRVPSISATATPPAPAPGPSSTPLAGPSPTAPVPGSSTPQEPPLSEPEAVVRRYFEAINARDYQLAWDLGGKNVGQSYAAFAKGFATTDRDVLTIRLVVDNTVTADLVAVQTDGSQRTFHGTYTVVGGIITRFSVRATG